MASAVLKVLRSTMTAVEMTATAVTTAVTTVAMVVFVPVVTTVVTTTASTAVTIVASVTASVVYLIVVTSGSVAANVYHSRRMIAPTSEQSCQLESVIVADASEVPVRADSSSH